MSAWIGRAGNMKAILQGGPAHGQLINHPKIMIYRHIIPKPIDLLTIQNTLQAAMNRGMRQLAELRRRRDAKNV
ncbi:MAG: hypothetical protein ACREHG_05855 [Candidatus Saccharimonadales bacterium]